MDMKKIFFATILMFATQESFAASVAVVDVQAVFNGTDLAKKTAEELRTESEKIREKMSVADSDLAEREQALLQQKSVLSEEAYMDAVAELRRVSREYRGDFQAEQDLINGKQRKVRNKITDEIEAAVKAYAAEKELDLVLPKNMMLYTGESVDLTDEILEKVNGQLNAKGM